MLDHKKPEELISAWNVPSSFQQTNTWVTGWQGIKSPTSGVASKTFNGPIHHVIPIVPILYYPCKGKW